MNRMVWVVSQFDGKDWDVVQVFENLEPAQEYTKRQVENEEAVEGDFLIGGFILQ